MAELYQWVYSGQADAYLLIFFLLIMLVIERR